MDENIIDDNDIYDEVEHAEVSAILDSTGETVEDFDKTFKKSNKGIYINIGPHSSKVVKFFGSILGLAIVAVLLCAMAVIIPTILLFAFGIVIVNKVLNIFRK